MNHAYIISYNNPNDFDLVTDVEIKKNAISCSLLASSFSKYRNRYKIIYSKRVFKRAKKIKPNELPIYVGSVVTTPVFERLLENHCELLSAFMQR